MDSKTETKGQRNTQTDRYRENVRQRKRDRDRDVAVAQGVKKSCLLPPKPILSPSYYCALSSTTDAAVSTSTYSWTVCFRGAGNDAYIEMQAGSRRSHHRPLVNNHPWRQSLGCHRNVIIILFVVASTVRWHAKVISKLQSLLISSD